MIFVSMLSNIAVSELCIGWSPLGPISSHCRSSFVACFPSARFSFGIRRWMMGGKNPSMLEKLCRIRVGVILICFDVAVASVRAIIKPVMVTISAASFKDVGIVMMGVFDGRKFEVRIRPAIMLPHARRPMGAMTALLFSLMGDRGRNRGEPMVTKKITRRL